MSLSLLFSVIIPAYNTASYIQQTLRSVYRQMDTDFEIIVINNGSPDNVAEILMQKTAPGLRGITPENGGVSRDRNKGIQVAHGKHLAFLDSDDVWKNKHLEIVRTIFDANPNTNWFVTNYHSAHEIDTSLINDQVKGIVNFKAVNWFQEASKSPSAQTL